MMHQPAHVIGLTELEEVSLSGKASRPINHWHQ
jgi:hypothetical protein